MTAQQHFGLLRQSLRSSGAAGPLRPANSPDQLLVMTIGVRGPEGKILPSARHTGAPRGGNWPEMQPSWSPRSVRPGRPARDTGVPSDRDRPEKPAATATAASA